MKRKSGKGHQRERTLPNEGYLINEDIRTPSLRVITQEGENLGVVSREHAIAAARNAGLDLVQIGGDNDENVIAKIMDFGRFLYEKKKQLTESKKKQKVVEIKELKFRPNIDQGDYNVKLSKVLSFLKEGKHVKLTLQFRGREIAMKKTMGEKLFERILNDVRADESIVAVEEQKESKGTNLWSKILVAKVKA